MARKRIAEAWAEFKKGQVQVIPPAPNPEIERAFYKSMEAAFYAGVVVLGEMIVNQRSEETVGQLMDEIHAELREFFKDSLDLYQKPLS